MFVLWSFFRRGDGGAGGGEQRLALDLRTTRAQVVELQGKLIGALTYPVLMIFVGGGLVLALIAAAIAIWGPLLIPQIAQIPDKGLILAGAIIGYHAKR
ncbi:MAG TPA: hypothetical protein EYP98_01495 [Planctomycetes bacterium]|nr:hypothetical protein [Planctomycetota bacterium]